MKLHHSYSRTWNYRIGLLSICLSWKASAWSLTKEAIRWELSTVSIHRNADYPLKNTSNKHNEYVVNEKLEHYNFYLIKLAMTTRSTLFNCLNSCNETLEKKRREIMNGELHRHRQHWAQDTTKTNKTNNPTQKNKKISNRNHTKNRRWTQVLMKGKQSMFLIRYCRGTRSHMW